MKHGEGWALCLSVLSSLIKQTLYLRWGTCKRLNLPPMAESTASFLAAEIDLRIRLACSFSSLFAISRENRLENAGVQERDSGPDSGETGKMPSNFSTSQSVKDVTLICIKHLRCIRPWSKHSIHMSLFVFLPRPSEIGQHCPYTQTRGTSPWISCFSGGMLALFQVCPFPEGRTLLHGNKSTYPLGTWGPVLFLPSIPEPK